MRKKSPRHTRHSRRNSRSHQKRRRSRSPKIEEVPLENEIVQITKNMSPEQVSQQLHEDITKDTPENVSKYKAFLEAAGYTIEAISAVLLAFYTFSRIPKEYRLQGATLLGIALTFYNMLQGNYKSEMKKIWMKGIKNALLMGEVTDLDYSDILRRTLL